MNVSRAQFSGKLCFRGIESENREKFFSWQEIKNIRTLINIEGCLKDIQIKRKMKIIFFCFVDL